MAFAVLAGLIGLLFPETLTAQEKPPQNGNHRTSVEAGSAVIGSTAGSLPFWFYSNVDGRVDRSGTNWLNQLRVKHALADKGPLKIGIGGNAVLRLSENSSLHFTELYLQAEAYGLRLDAGRFRQPIGLNNHGLSVGSMMVSRNAIPVPRVSLSTSGFANVPGTRGRVEFKGMFSHGWLEKDRHVESPFLHQKYLYLRVNIGSWSTTGGIVHNAQWGGTDPNRGSLPQSFNDYLRLIAGRGAASSSNAPGGEISNVIGNSVAAYDFGLQYEHKKFTASLTRLFYLEDKVSTRFRSPWDGVWGANVKFKGDNNLLRALTYEHINTKNQDAKDFELIGRRDYYDNFLYRSGWTYENRTLGIPLILFDGTTITNNVLIGHHVGFEGQLVPGLEYTGYFTYSRNYGVRNDWVTGPISDSIPEDRNDIIPREQFREDQYSMLIGLNYRLPGRENITLNMKLGADLGELYEDAFGIMAGITWNSGGVF